MRRAALRRSRFLSLELWDAWPWGELRSTRSSHLTASTSQVIAWRGRWWFRDGRTRWKVGQRYPWRIREECRGTEGTIYDPLSTSCREKHSAILICSVEPRLNRIPHTVATRAKISKVCESGFELCLFTCSTLIPVAGTWLVADAEAVLF